MKETSGSDVPLKKYKSLTEDAYRSIKEMIFKGAVAPGQRLIYTDLSGLLNVSRTPIVNALIRLEREGFLVSSSNRGFYVKPIDLHETFDLFDFRQALESFGIAQVVLLANDEDIQKLEIAQTKHANYKPRLYDHKKFVMDAEFHIQLMTITGNSLLIESITRVLEHVYLRHRPQVSDPRRMTSAAEEHRRLIEAIKEKNVNVAIDLTRKHILKARDVIVGSLIEEQKTMPWILRKAR